MGKPDFHPGDVVEIRANGAWNGEVGRIVHISGPNIYVKTWGMSTPHPFVAAELRHSQQRLLQPEQYEP